MDILDCLHRDHRLIRELMIELQTTARDFTDRQRALQLLVEQVEAHAKAEEAVVMLYALSSTEPGDEMRSCALEAIQLHDLAETYARSILDNKRTKEELWDAQVKVYLHLIDHQLDEEEHELFPELYERMSDPERNEMGVRYMRALKASRKAVRINATKQGIEAWFAQTGA